MSSETYNPAEYWNMREHPNTAAAPDINVHDRQFITPILEEAKSVLELGPGVGRLFPLYKNVPRVATVDLSRNYADRAKDAALNVGISVEAFYLDTPLAPLPFMAGEFDVGIAAHVLMHVPFENIEHSMSELARVCKQVRVISVVHRFWPKKGTRFDPKWHCFNHDYEAICKSLNLQFGDYEKFSEGADIGSFGFSFRLNS
ncbi:class I SAM-dependent methyltransferase [Aquabacter spiritensis]|uniref:class I SAM-dependent methyltransferase n=1 Tax=Aquabacter spiritensis TaxID=933073 RepID=UPI001048099F|nr:class I SAM-dependent methyltransferase [Aquabacter spiritensis]